MHFHSELIGALNFNFFKLRCAPIWLEVAGNVASTLCTNPERYINKLLLFISRFPQSLVMSTFYTSTPTSRSHLTVYQ